MDTETNQQKSAENSPACRTGACCPLQSRWGLVFWAVLIGLVVYAQWPMIKGMYYKSSNAAAPESAIAWRSDYPAALAEAQTSGKPVLIDFTASWCPPCKVMKHETWPDARVADAVNGVYIPLLIDVDEAKNAEVQRRYGVSSIPTILVVDSRGEVLNAGSFMSASELLKFLKSPA